MCNIVVFISWGQKCSEERFCDRCALQPLCKVIFARKLKGTNPPSRLFCVPFNSTFFDSPSFRVIKNPKMCPAYFTSTYGIEKQRQDDLNMTTNTLDPKDMASVSVTSSATRGSKLSLCEFLETLGFILQWKREAFLVALCGIFYYGGV